MVNFFKKTKAVTPENTKVIQMSDIPLTASGEPDIQAILAAIGLSHVDVATVVTGDGADKEKILEAVKKMS